MIIPAGTPEQTSLLYKTDYPDATVATVTLAPEQFTLNAPFNFLTNVFEQIVMTDPSYVGKDKLVLQLTHPDTTVHLVEVHFYFGPDYSYLIKEGVAIAYSPTGGDAGTVEKMDLVFTDGGNTFTQQQTIFFQETGLLPGDTSFMMEQQLIVWAMRRLDTPLVSQMITGDLTTFRVAMSNAYMNICKLNIELRVSEGTVNDRTVYSPADLTEQDLTRLSQTHQRQFMNAQIIEANYLLGGDPIEERRKAGLLSHSAGESTHFFQTTKPVSLPVSRKTADALKGIISWTARIKR